MKLFPTEICAAAGIIDLKLPILIHGFLRARSLHQRQPALGHPEPGQKFFHRKRFCQVIIRSRVQRVDLIRILAPGADHDDRDIGPAPDPADHLDAVQIREPQIQKNNIRIMGSRLHDRRLSGLGGQEPVSLGL